MRRLLSDLLERDMLQSTQNALRDGGIVNIPVVAESVRRRNEAENVALEDIEHAILLLAQRLNAPIAFDRFDDLPATAAAS